MIVAFFSIKTTKTGYQLDKYDVIVTSIYLADELIILLIFVNNSSRLLVKREKFAKHVMVSAGVCFGGKGRLHFVDEKAKVDAQYYVGRLLPELIKDCNQLMPAGFIFQQDGAPAHTARVTQEWLHANCPEMIEKDQWPPNSPDLNPLDYHIWGAMLDRYHKLQLHYTC